MMPIVTGGDIRNILTSVFLHVADSLVHPAHLLGELLSALIVGVGLALHVVQLRHHGLHYVSEVIHDGSSIWLLADVGDVAVDVVRLLVACLLPRTLSVLRLLVLVLVS